MERISTVQSELERGEDSARSSSEGVKKKITY
jgi:hypothetical protein